MWPVGCSLPTPAEKETQLPAADLLLLQLHSADLHPPTGALALRVALMNSTVVSTPTPLIFIFISLYLPLPLIVAVIY